MAMKLARSLLPILIFLWAFHNPACAETALRVGLALPLSGVGAPYGRAYYNGLMFELSQKPGAVELVIEDHQYDNKSSLAAVRKLTQIDKVSMVVVWGYGPSDAVAPIVPKHGAPFMLGSLNPVGKERPEILNLSAPLKVTLAPLVEYLKGRERRKISIIAAQIGAMDQSAQVLEAALAADRPTLERVMPDQLDFRSLIARLKAAEVNSLGLFLTPAQIKSFVQQAQSLQFIPEYFGMDTFNDAVVLDLFSDQGNGPIFVDAFSDPIFMERYKERFRDVSHAVEAARGALLGQLLLHISAHGRNSMGIFANAGILQALSAFPSGRGPAGAYEIVEDPNFGTYLAVRQVLYQISNGKVRNLL
ncbi:MAG: ABC transporter substrate-binding protein [Oligoflexia bacterium]|nr:ABC transporter substrate-binding protein [Oligoflexia bacterium]